MIRYLLLPLLLAGYIALAIPFAAYMRNKPFLEKLGYIPQPEVLKFVAADQKIFLADSLVMKTLFYFGSLVEKSTAKFVLPPDYFTIYKTIETAVKLDPYNMDAYYFTQAVLVWDAKRIKEANALLEHGMKYRDWDQQLPFFLGFNHAYFLKDYQNAARFYRRAADLSGAPLLANLAGRYMYEAGQTDLALAYLATMEKSARNAAIKKEFQVRITAFQEVKRIESAIARCRSDFGAAPATVDELLQKGCLKGPPVDPYGGQFFIDENGQVRSTSKFAFAAKSGDQQR
jgi:tetratricopeptide (TPR) repeat protein